MLVDPDTLRLARKGRRDAVVEVLSAQYPSTYRLAYSISGREDVGHGIVQFVMKQSLRAVPTWADDAAPQRWFRHHTLLTLRRAAKWKPDAGSDTLVAAADAPDGAYVAFVRALRGLTQQQTEAYLLTHGEQLDLRGAAVAMDCSTIAARMHLHEAEQRLRSLAGDGYDKMLAKLRDAHARLAPTEDLVLSRVSGSVRRWLLPRRIIRSAMLGMMVLVLAALAGLGWHFREPIYEALHSVLGVP